MKLFQFLESMKSDILECLKDFGVAYSMPVVLFVWRITTLPFLVIGTISHFVYCMCDWMLQKQSKVEQKLFKLL